MTSISPSIDKLFGPPMVVPVQAAGTFKVKGWHIVAGIAVGVFVAYGMYCAQRDVLRYFRQQYIDKNHLKAPKSSGGTF